MPRLGDNLHSRIVAWTKIILPLAALAILSSLFLFSKSHDPTEGVRLLTGKLADYANNERITGPRFAGMTPSGVAIQISAERASPRLPDGTAFDATDLRARVELPDGSVIDVVATRGSVDQLARQAIMTDGVTLDTSLGYFAFTPGLTFAMDRLDIQSQGEITASGPLGKIRAGGMHVFLEDAKTGDESPGYVLVFNNGVKLIYTP